MGNGLLVPVLLPVRAAAEVYMLFEFVPPMIDSGDNGVERHITKRAETFAVHIVRDIQQ